MELTVGKVSIFGVFMVRIFPHSDLIGKDTPYSPHSVGMWQNTDQKNFQYGHFSRSGYQTNTISKQEFDNTILS